MTKLNDMSVTEAANKAIELLLYANYTDAVKGSKWSAPYTGTFEQWLEETHDGELDSNSLWQELKYEGSEGTRDGWTGKVAASYGGEGQGDQFWMVVSVSDGTTTRFFRRDGYYASYDGGYLDGETYEVKPQEKTVVFYE